MHHDLSTVSFTSAEQTTTSDGTFFCIFWNTFFPNPVKEGRFTALLSHCPHSLYILRIPLHNGMQGGMLISHLRQAEWRTQEHNHKTLNSAKNIVFLEQG